MDRKVIAILVVWVDSSRKLQQYLVDIITIPYNRTCYFIDKVQDKIYC